MFNKISDKHMLIPVTAETVTAEAISIPAGAAGTVKEVQLAKRPVLSANGGSLGGNGDTSLSFGTGTCFTTEVSPDTKDSDLANGEYWVDYASGIIHGKKATTATSDTATYKALSLNTDIDADLDAIAGLVTSAYDYIALTYVTAGNGIGEIETVVFKTGGSGGTTVATLTLAYDGSNRLSSVTKS